MIVRKAETSRLFSRLPLYYAKGSLTCTDIDGLGDDELCNSLDTSADVTEALVLYYCLARSVFARAFWRKGADRHVVQQIADDIAWLGHVRLVLWSNSEPAILALVTEALRGLRVLPLDPAAVSSEGLVACDPHTNGAVEVAVRNVKNSPEANLLTLEARSQSQIPIDVRC